MTDRSVVLMVAVFLFANTGAVAQDTDEILDFIDSRYESTAAMASAPWSCRAP